MVLYNIVKDGVVIKVTPRLSYVKWDGVTDHARIVEKEEATGILVDTTIYNIANGPSNIPGADTVFVSPVDIPVESTTIDSSTIPSSFFTRLQAVENILMANYRNLVFQDNQSKVPWVTLYSERIMENTAKFGDVPSDLAEEVTNALAARGFEYYEEEGGGEA